jgi:hypothetical protein
MFDPVLYCLMSQCQGLTCWECLIEALPNIFIEIRSNESSDSIPFGMRAQDFLSEGFVEYLKGHPTSSYIRVLLSIPQTHVG